jgi:hypothetical protein
MAQPAEIARATADEQFLTFMQGFPRCDIFAVSRRWYVRWIAFK